MNTGMYTLHKSYQIYNSTLTVSPHYVIKLEQNGIYTNTRDATFVQFANV